MSYIVKPRLFAKIRCIILILLPKFSKASVKFNTKLA